MEMHSTSLKKICFFQGQKFLDPNLSDNGKMRLNTTLLAALSEIEACLFTEPVCSTLFAISLCRLQSRVSANPYYRSSPGQRR